jgi:predicted anti-sigma-YlaC factor YlaD
MECDRAREAVSACIDGEDPGLPGGALQAHLASCAECRDWQQRAHEVTRRARLGGPFLEHDLTDQVLAAIGPGRADRRGPGGPGRSVARRTGLAVAAIAQLAITVPLLILGHDHGAGTHAAHELGSFDLALAIAFAVGAIRPALSAGLAWPCGVAAAGLMSTAIADLTAGQTFGADEAQHLIAAAGAALLFWQARTIAAGTAGPSLATAWRGDLLSPTPTRTAGQPAVPWPETPKGPGDDGIDAAQVTGPDVAARGGGRVA